MYSIQILLTGCVALMCVSLLPLHHAKTIPIPTRNLAKSLELLGTVDGRTFYVEHEPKRTWVESLEFCRNNSLELASITSYEQASFLFTVNETTHLNGSYWTSARDRMFNQAFEWEDDLGTFPQLGDFPNGWTRNLPVDPPHFCAAFNEVNAGGMRTRFCTEKFGTLCYHHVTNQTTLQKSHSHKQFVISQR